MGKRVKQYKKLMRSFQMLGFREPYQLLMTSDIILDTLKLDLLSLFEKTLSTKNLKPMITQCCIRALYARNKDPDVARAIERAKTFERRRCGHLMDEDAHPERECMLSVIDPKKKGENKFRYIVATQDEHLREMLRSVVPTPLMYVKRSVLILEPMAESSQKAREREERAKFMAGIVRGSKRKREDDDEGEEAKDAGNEEMDSGDERAKKREEEAKPNKKKKNHGPKGPNPLAVKKKKKENEGRKDKNEKKSAAAAITDGAATEEKAPGETKPKRKRRKKAPTAGAGNAESGSGEKTEGAPAADAGKPVVAEED